MCCGKRTTGRSTSRGWVDDGPATSQSGAADPQGRNRGPTPKTYAHPYYWAPFVLMGNWL
jgi:CHAT domain-containing protein